jgi:hypothetical protein
MKNIIVVGNGKTSRANVEALIDDYFYANPEMVVYIPVYDSLSEGQAWALQYAAEKNKKVIAKAQPQAKTFGVPKNSLDEKAYDSPLKDILQSDTSAEIFVLWDETDEISRLAVSTALELGKKAFDLTNGLLEITLSNTDSEPEVEPETPDTADLFGITLVQQQDISDLDLDDDWDPLESIEEMDSATLGKAKSGLSDKVTDDLLLFAIKYLASYIADEVMERIEDVLDK